MLGTIENLKKEAWERIRQGDPVALFAMCVTATAALGGDVSHVKLPSPERVAAYYGNSKECN